MAPIIRSGSGTRPSASSPLDPILAVDFMERLSRATNARRQFQEQRTDLAHTSISTFVAGVSQIQDLTPPPNSPCSSKHPQSNRLSIHPHPYHSSILSQHVSTPHSSSRSLRRTASRRSVQFSNSNQSLRQKDVHITIERITEDTGKISLSEFLDSTISIPATGSTSSTTPLSPISTSTPTPDSTNPTVSLSLPHSSARPTRPPGRLRVHYSRSPSPVPPCPIPHATRRSPTSEDCSICSHPLADEALENLVWCKGACGHNFHRNCFDEWREYAARPLRCVYCRSIWRRSCEHDHMCFETESAPLPPAGRS